MGRGMAMFQRIVQSNKLETDWQSGKSDWEKDVAVPVSLHEMRTMRGPEFCPSWA